MAWTAWTAWTIGPVARRWGILAAVWGGIAFFSVTQIYIARAAGGHPPPLVPLLVLEVPIWLFWAMITVPVVMLARRLPLDRDRAVAHLAVHGPASVTVATLAVAFQTLWYQAFNPYPLGGSSVSAWFWQYFRQHFIVGFVLYWAIVGVYHALVNHLRYRERELEASRTKAQLSEARLQALKMQLHPHFLFNTLNSISALLSEDPGAARRVLAHLAELLRACLRSDAVHLIPLEDEVAFLRRYLEIERVRFGERLAVELEIAPETRRAAVPAFLLQPLVENAVHHGVAHRERGGRVRLKAARTNGTLVIHVEDDGPGLRAGSAREGIGLATTRRRLEELYGQHQSLSLGLRAGGGTDVCVSLPYRRLDGAG